MAGTADVKTLLLEVDASVELLRRNLTRGDQAVGAFESETKQRLDRMDRRFEQLGGGLRQLPGTIGRARAQIASIGTTVERVEGQVRASTGAMRSALLSSTAAIGAALSVNQIKDYADGYTRFTNQLKVAGQEGAALAQTQNDLFGIAQRYGVQLEAIGTLFGRNAASAKELGLGQSQQLRIAEATAAAIKVTGQSTEEASGALLQFSQLLGGTNVQAQEYNSLIDGARPLLQAVAAGSDKWAGSVAKLSADVKAGKVSVKEFVDALLKGSGGVIEQAAKSNLTIGASFTILNNAIGKYIGETDASLSATQRVSGGVAALANNLDTIVPALTTIAVAYGSVKVAGLAFGGVTNAVASVAAADQALARQVLLGNASFVSRTELAARSAQLAAAGAATEVAGIENTIVARRAEQAVLAEQIAAERTLIVERRAAAQAAAVSLTQGGLNGRTTALAAQRAAENDAAFATARLTAARQRLALVDGELTVAEGTLAGAQTRAALAADVAAAASTRATLAARAGAAASRLFAGALTLIGGSVAGGAAILAIGALAAAVIYANGQMREAEERNKATAQAMRDSATSSQSLNEKLTALAATAGAASSAVTRVGNSAAGSIGQVLAFAGAVGEAAQKLYQLAAARRHEQVLGFTTESVASEHRANEAQARIDARQADNRGAVGRRGFSFASGADRQANQDDARIVAAERAKQGEAYRAAQRAANIPLAARVRESDRVGGRDVDGDLARVTRDLVVARKRGIRAQVDSLEAQKYELTQYKAYRKQGLSPQAAQEQASQDSGKLRGAAAGAQGDRDAKTSRTARTKAEREAAAESRKQAAEARKQAVAVKDAAADERAFSSAERQANNDIATARADLSNSATERAQIEKERIESERRNRANEIEQQAKQGGLGSGTVAETRKLELQRLNDERATLETQVVDARERQRVADESLAVAQAGRSNQVDLLQKQSDLTTSLSQRRDLELRILNIQYDEERARLEGLIASRDTTAAEREIARQRLAVLGQLQAADRAGVDRKNAGPVQQYRDRLRAASGDVHEALDDVAARGLQNLEEGLLGIVTGTESVGSAFKKMAASIIADLARIAIQKAILSAIGKSFLGFADGGSLGGVPGRADGGSLGGLISGPGNGRSDSILAMLSGPGGGAVRLSNREFIMNEGAVNYYGQDMMAALNSRRFPRFADGGGIGVPSTLALSAPSVGSLHRSNPIGNGAPILITLAVKKGEAFEAEVLSVSVPASVQVLQNNAGALMDAAANHTIAKLRQPSL